MRGVYRLSDLDLASRLSFFLWSSVPDDPLVELASRRRLRDPVVLRAQVRRMLADPRSRSIADSFAMQWLKMDILKGFVPDPFTFPEWDDNLRDAMREETRLFVADQLASDRGVVELLTGDYTFMNERLARHYDVPHVYGAHFRRVTVGEGARGGLLGHASILTSTSYPDRTSPVLRGKWLLDNMLGSPIPAPPPDVPALVETRADGKQISIREQMQMHRTSPVCASCHQRMDPLGLSLEHYDPIGRWRATSDGQAVDASGTLTDGTRFEGLVGLRQYLARHRQDFVRAVVEKLLSYAIGRGTGPHDQPVIRKIMKDAAPDDYRWSSIIQGIVTSVPFTMGQQDADVRAHSARIFHPTPPWAVLRPADEGSRNP